MTTRTRTRTTRTKNHYHLPFSRTKVKGSETRLVSVKLGRKTVAEASLEESNKTPKKTWQCPGKKT